MALRLQALAGLLALAAAATAAAQPAPCITDFVVAQDVSLAGGAVAFCDDHPKRPTCFSIDLATGKATTITKPTTTTTTAPGPKLTITRALATVCLPGKPRCTVLRPLTPIDPVTGMHGVTNPTGTLAALVNANQVETFDPRTGKRLAGFSAGEAACTRVAFLAGDTLLVTNTDCGSRGPGTSRLVTAHGTPLAPVGGTRPIDALTPVALAGSRAAFLSRTGDTVVIHDVKTGAVEQRIAIGPPATDAAPKLVGDPARLAIVFGGARWGDVAVVDLATAKVTVHPAKRCPL